MQGEVIYHKPWGAYAYPLAPKMVSITLQVKKKNIRSCYLIHGDPWKPDVPMQKTRMDKVATDDSFDYFRTIIKVPSRRIRYVFLVEKGEKQLWYSEIGLTTQKPKVGELGLPYFEIFK